MQCSSARVGGVRRAARSAIRRTRAAPPSQCVPADGPPAAAGAAAVSAAQVPAGHIPAATVSAAVPAAAVSAAMVLVLAAAAARPIVAFVDGVFAEVVLLITVQVSGITALPPANKQSNAKYIEADCMPPAQARWFTRSQAHGWCAA